MTTNLLYAIMAIQLIIIALLFFILVQRGESAKPGEVIVDTPSFKVYNKVKPRRVSVKKRKMQKPPKSSLTYALFGKKKKDMTPKELTEYGRIITKRNEDKKKHEAKTKKQTKKENLSIAMKKKWASYTPEQRAVRIQNTKNARAISRMIKENKKTHTLGT